jgi:hypothetical protein
MQGSLHVHKLVRFCYCVKSIHGRLLSSSGCSCKIVLRKGAVVRSGLFLSRSRLGSSKIKGAVRSLGLDRQQQKKTPEESEERERERA